MEYFPVELQVLFPGTVIGMFCPQGSRLIEQFRTLLDLQLCGLRFLLLGLALCTFFPFLVFGSIPRGICSFPGILCLLFLLLRLDDLQHHIILPFLILLDDLGLCGIRLGQVDLCGHERTVLLDHFPGLVLVAELQTVFIQEQGHCGTHFRPVAVLHRKLCTPIAFPMDGNSAILIGKGINLNLICHHECRIETQAEMSDDLVCIALVLILLDEIRGTGERNLVDILLHLVSGHTQPVVRKGQGLLLRVNGHTHPGLVTLRQGIFPHHVQLFQLGHGITAVGDQLPVENIMVRVQPLLDNGKNVLTID